jgi:23S rRNA pseudouridine2605 synthase
MTEERLQKVLAHAGVSSRRKAEEIIVSGRVSVNGQVVRELGVKVDAARDRILVDGRPVGEEATEYWLLNKPPGVITTVVDPQGRPTARGMVPTRARVYPVGRLDADSSGLLLFTNNGALAQRLMHPRHEHEKEYQVLVAGTPTADDIQRLRRGVALDGRLTVPADVRLLGTQREGTWLAVVLREGRNRQIRRMMDVVGHRVLALVRVRIGPITLGELPPGQARRLTAAEEAALRALAPDET